MTALHLPIWITVVYVAGAAITAWFTDGSLLIRVGFAVVWPVGPAAFIVTVSGLLLVAAVAFPTFGAVAAALGLLAWWWLSASG